MNKPKIRLWIFNNPIRGITDQLDFLRFSLQSAGYVVSISNHPAPDALNVLIENLNEKTYPELEKFCKATGKRVAVVMTEHVDFVDRGIYFHGLPFNIPTEYMHAMTRRVRLLHLLIAKQHLRAFFRLGDLPALIGLDDMFPGIPIATLPFPQIPVQDRALGVNANMTHDLVFTGALTSYRRHVLDLLGQQFNILVADKQVSRRRRDAMTAQAKAVLNIPQDADWRWISSMRIMAAWRCGRPVVNVGLGMEGILGPCCLNVAPELKEFGLVRKLLEEPLSAFQRQKAAYDCYVMSEGNGVFPDALFRTWAITELGA